MNAVPTAAIVLDDTKLFGLRLYPLTIFRIETAIAALADWRIISLDSAEG
jgi:hypothetical protein